MIKYCKTCLTPSSRPRVTFNADGICNACLNMESKNAIDWETRKQEFVELVDRYRAHTGPYDCIVPWSGGKDSSYIAWRLKFEFGLNPLLVTFSPLLPNEVGVHNREEMLKAGFDQVLLRPNQKVGRRLARRFFIERGNPKVAWDAGINSWPVRAAVKFGIPLIFYAEHGESEYGGRVLSEESKKMRNFTEVIENIVGDDPHNWVDDVIGERDVAPYAYPSPEEIAGVGVRALYFSYFFRWSMYDNYQFIKGKIDFHLAPGGRTNGTFTGFDSLDDKIDNLYYYMQFVKFGFGRASRDASRLVHNGHMTRAEALDVTRKYDDEFPSTFFNDNLEYLGLTEPEFTEIVDQHRNPEIWERSGNAWKLRWPPV